MKTAQMKVEFVDKMGDDLSVANAARVSFDKKTEYVQLSDDSVSIKSGDVKLIKYLADHNHWTPFGHAFVSLRIKAPIFVARQLVKHQVGLVWNEVSRRYVSSEPEMYFPDCNEWRKRAENVKQGSAEECFHFPGFEQRIRADVAKLVQLYDEMLVIGVCPEQARMVLPQNMMTEWIWSGSLMAFSRVCKLRLDPHTQKETRLIAEQIDGIIQPLFPVSWSALKGDLNAV